MPNTIRLKRSATVGKIPLAADLQLGELAVNTNDGKLYLKKDNGAASVVEVGPVTSVAGRTGAVTLGVADVAGSVTSVAGRTGAVALAIADVADLATSLTPIGAVIPYAGLSAPPRWLFCFGQNVSRTTYAALFASIGTTYGAGNGSTTFGLPDLRGRVVAGQDDMGGSSANRLTSPLDGDVLGGVGGAQSVTLTAAEQANMAASATVVVVGGGGTNNPGTNLNGGAYPPPVYASNGGTGYTILAIAGSTIGGGGGAHNNVQPTQILNYMIHAGV